MNSKRRLVESNGNLLMINAMSSEVLIPSLSIIYEIPRIYRFCSCIHILTMDVFVRSLNRLYKVPDPLNDIQNMP